MHIVLDFRYFSQNYNNLVIQKRLLFIGFGGVSLEFNSTLRSSVSSCSEY